MSTRLRLNQLEKEMLAEQLKAVILSLRQHLLDPKAKKYVNPQIVDIQSGLELELKDGKIWVEKSSDQLPELCLSVGTCLRIENRLVGSQRPTFIILCPCLPPSFRQQLQDQVSQFTGRTLDNQMSATSYALLQVQLYLSKAAPGLCLRQIVDR